MNLNKKIDKSIDGWYHEYKSLGDKQNEINVHRRENNENEEVVMVV